MMFLGLNRTLKLLHKLKARYKNPITVDILYMYLPTHRYLSITRSSVLITENTYYWFNSKTIECRPIMGCLNINDAAVTRCHDDTWQWNVACDGNVTANNVYNQCVIKCHRYWAQINSTSWCGSACMVYYYIVIFYLHYIFYLYYIIWVYWSLLFCFVWKKFAYFNLTIICIPNLPMYLLMLTTHSVKYSERSSMSI